MAFAFRSALLVAALLACAQPAFAAEPRESSAEKQRKLLAVLQSDAPPQDKAIACKSLAIYGDKQAVPLLTPLLADPKLASWARIPLEAIPDPAADKALREALDNLRGSLLVGVINSIGVRHDAKAIPALITRLNDGDIEVAAAAAESLGHIGGSQAVAALTPLLASSQEQLRSAAAYGCILCAEKLLAGGKSARAIELYDALRQANLPKPRVLEATRGAILARKTEGIPLLLEQLHSSDKAMFGIALRTARELPGKAVSKALATELDSSAPARQTLLFSALADRTDSAAAAKILQVAQNGPRDIRKLALGLLDRFPAKSSVALLLNAATDADAEVAQTAKTILVRMGGKEADADVAARLPKARGKTCQVLIELARQRHIVAALPAVRAYAKDSDSAVRAAALKTLGSLGEEADSASLVRQLTEDNSSAQREDIEQALLAICGRVGASSLPHIQILARHENPALRCVALRTVAVIGGNNAVNLVKNAIDDKDEAVQDEAAQILAEWPANWPKDTSVSDPLLALAKSAGKPARQAQGLRGYFKFIQETGELSPEAKLARMREVLPLAKSAPEKKLAVAVLGAIPAAGSLNLLIDYAHDSEVAEEACLAITLCAKQGALLPREALIKALKTAADLTKNENTRKQATEAMSHSQ